MEAEKHRKDHRIKPDFRKFFRFIKCPFPGDVKDACNENFTEISSSKNQTQLLKRETYKDENKETETKRRLFLSCIIKSDNAQKETISM